MSYFSQSKVGRGTKSENELTSNAIPGNAPKMSVTSILGDGVLVTGNIICMGALQISGRVVGDIHSASVTICEGAKVEGKITATDVTIQGVFNGTISANAVKLMNTAVVEGEIFNKSLVVEQDASFEGTARRLDKPMAPPTEAQATGEDIAPAMVPKLAPQPDTVS